MGNIFSVSLLALGLVTTASYADESPLTLV